MTVGDHPEEFYGFPVVEFKSEKPLKNPDKTSYRLSLDYDAGEAGDTMADLIGEYVDAQNASETRALIIGAWENCYDSSNDSSSIVEALVAARGKLSKLEALFLGDITFEESEISWIGQTDVSPIFSAFPGLRHFRVRGGTNLGLGRIHHSKLQTLIIEAGGLGRDVVRDVLSSDLPELTFLELWLGDENYGGDTTLEDLQPVFSGKLFPKLKHLGIQNSEFQDEIARAIADAPITSRLESVSLSMGTLGDDGAEALLKSAAIKKLKALDLHHHYLSDAIMKKFQSLGPDVNLDEQEEAEPDDRYVAVSE